MSVSMYQASVPHFIRTLENLSKILEKAAGWAETRKIDQLVLTGARLAPDMYPLTRQVQIATDIPKGCAARLAGVEVPSYADNETTFPELQARLKKTIEFLKSIKPAQIDGSEERTVNLKAGPRELSFKGADYLFSFAFPNIHFHATTAYDILRNCGLEIGKQDYLGKIQ